MLLFDNLADWGSVANIVLATMSVFTAIVTAWMLLKQHKIQKEQLNAQHLEHQPIFRFDKSGEASTIIYNNGCAMSAPAKIELTTMMFIEPLKYSEKNMRLEYYLNCIPLKYYTSTRYTRSLTNELAVFQKQNKEKQQLLDNTIREYKKSLWSSINLVFNEETQLYVADVTKIEYIDMYKIRRKVFYLNSTEISEQLYWLIHEYSKDYWSAPYEIEYLNQNRDSILKEILQYKHKQG